MRCPTLSCCRGYEQSADQRSSAFAERGIDFRQLFDRQNCRYPHSSANLRLTSHNTKLALCVSYVHHRVPVTINLSIYEFGANYNVPTQLNSTRHPTTNDSYQLQPQTDNHQQQQQLQQQQASSSS